MKPIDFRNTTFAELRGQLVKKREAVWLDWHAYEIELQAAGQSLGATTREVCERFGRDILQFRPRCTELFQMGVLAVVDGPATQSIKDNEGNVAATITLAQGSSREGRYRLRPLPEWEAWCAAQRADAVSNQQQLI